MTLPRTAALATALTLAVAGGAQAAGTGIDRSIYATDVPAGAVEHGTIAVTTTGTHPAHVTDRRIEYWASRSVFRTRTTDARTGEVVADQTSTRQGTRIRRGGRTTWLAGPEMEPRPGWSSAYTAKLIARGAVTPAGERTVAGRPGLVYVSRPEGGWRTDDERSVTTLVVERGTGIALERTTEAPNGRFGTFRQSEVLLSRAYLAPSARVTRELRRHRVERRGR